MKQLALRLFGHGLTLIFGDTLVLDRWRWLIRYLPPVKGKERLIDIGCGTGAFTLGAAKLGYTALGLSWDERNNNEATARAKTLNLPNARFQTFDLRHLDQLPPGQGLFDYAICCENIEHIIGDAKLVRDIHAILAPSGRLLLTSPNFYYRPMSDGDAGPFEPIEDGRHVRRGYSSAELRELLEAQGFLVETIEYCSGYFSQRITTLLRALSRLSHKLAWTVTLPLRILPILFDRPSSRGRRPGYSICAVAVKPRFAPGKEPHNG